MDTNQSNDSNSDRFSVILLRVNAKRVTIHQFSLIELLAVSWRVISYQLPVASYQLPVTSCQLPVASYQLPVTSYQLPVASYHCLKLIANS